MATHLVVRNVELSIVQALKEAAVRHGRSTEAEHREILRAALTRPARRSIKDVLALMTDVGADEDFDFRRA